MTTVLVILIVWVVLSVPAALLLARMFRSGGAAKRGRKEPELSPGATEFDRHAEEFTHGPRAGEGDTHRVFPPR
ncbi:hypothetical protein [Nocardia sp. NBC_01327]|uniref:hypothetical protein n=1 Tax=Nocardia sp. NBC_01327 TaxID=2903593 RepID=UPI002E13E667|nr:hypothetical protein OG326_11400 [Nocardia sp. NBC_01327]